MPLRWASCLFRPTGAAASSLEVNPATCPLELQEQLVTRGTSCLRPRGSQVLYERFDDAGQGAFTPPVLIYLKRLHLSSGLEVCIKRTLITHFIGRAAREARLQVQLQHPHLLPALASVRGRHHYYLVLPAAEGDLWAEAEAMRQQGSGYSEDELREVARQVLLGLEHLHASHLAHRDIKPANLLRMSDGRVVVADFGCADSCTAGFVAAGTTQFQPPECRRGSGSQLAVLPKGYDQRAQDMWSLGSTLATLWFARMPEVVRGSGNRSGTAGAGTTSSSLTPAASVTAAGASGAATSRSTEGCSSAAAAAAAAATATAASAVAADGPASSCSVAAAPSPTFPAAAPGDDPVVSPLPSPASSPGAATAAAAAPPPPLPAFLAAAGFAGCPSTVGACGAPMSPELLDLLALMLRLRPAERATATQALQHAWLVSAPAGAQAARQGPADTKYDSPRVTANGEERQAAAEEEEDVSPAVLSQSPTPTPPRRQLDARSARSAGALQQPLAASSSASSPLKRLRTAEERFLHFFSHQQLLLPRASTGASAPSGEQQQPPQQQQQQQEPQQQPPQLLLQQPQQLKSFGLGQYRQSASCLLEHGGMGSSGTGFERPGIGQFRDAALRQSHDGEITVHLPPRSPTKKQQQQHQQQQQQQQQPAQQKQQQQQRQRAQSRSLGGEEEEEDGQGRYHQHQKHQKHNIWLRPASQPQQQHQKRGGRMTLRVFVGAGAEPANSS